MGPRRFKGIYVSGLGHSGRRPNFYEHLGLFMGTINVQLPAETDEHLLVPEVRIHGLDAFDLEEEHQDFLIRACTLKGVRGYQILPIDKTTSEPRGHHQEKILEISLQERIEVVLGDELEVELDF